MRCVVIDDFQRAAAGYADWSGLPGVETHFSATHPESDDDLVDLLAGATIAVTLRERVTFTRGVLQRLPELRLLVATGMRNSAIDLDAARDLGIVVSGTASSLTPPAELTWALILGLSRHLVTEHLALAGGRWQTTVGRDLHRRTLGVVGLGRVGAAVARVGSAFGMDVVAWSQHLTQERADEIGVRRAGSLDELLAASDVVTIHLKLGERSRGLLGAPQIALMKDDALLVNTARSAIVDEAALTAALRAGHLAGAGLDVFDVEPLPADAPIRTAPRTLLTPHLGYVTDGNYRTYFSEAVEDIRAFLGGHPIRVLNPAP